MNAVLKRARIHALCGFTVQHMKSGIKSVSKHMKREGKWS